MAGVTQKSSVAAFPLCFFQQQMVRYKEEKTKWRILQGFLLPIGVFIYNEELETKQGR